MCRPFYIVLILEMSRHEMQSVEDNGTAYLLPSAGPSIDPETNQGIKPEVTFYVRTQAKHAAP